MGARPVRAQVPAGDDCFTHDLRLHRPLAAHADARALLLAPCAGAAERLEGPRDYRNDERLPDRVQQRLAHRDGALDEPGDPLVHPCARGGARHLHRGQDTLQGRDRLPHRHLHRRHARGVGGVSQRAAGHHPDPRLHCDAKHTDVALGTHHERPLGQARLVPDDLLYRPSRLHRADAVCARGRVQHLFRVVGAASHCHHRLLARQLLRRGRLQRGTLPVGAHALVGRHRHPRQRQDRVPALPLFAAARRALVVVGQPVPRLLPHLHLGRRLLVPQGHRVQAAAAHARRPRHEERRRQLSRARTHALHESTCAVRHGLHLLDARARQAWPSCAQRLAVIRTTLSLAPAPRLKHGPIA